MRYSFLSLMVVFAVSIGLVAGCGASEKAKEAKLTVVDYQKAMDLLATDNPPVVVDVRTPEEFNNELGHIPGARLIPMDATRDSLDVYRQLQDRGILVVCRSGRRSGIVGDELVKSGIKNVYNLAGGMKSWNENGGEIERNMAP